MSRSFNTPVVFLIYNRPVLTRRVFEEIRRLRPSTLFVIADGPGSWWPDDAARCRAARDAVAEVDWPCTVHREYAPTNMGCGNRISSGLDWVFSQVEEAIVVEDDCLPSQRFFSYCEELLDRFRDDPRVFCISGFSPPVPKLAAYRYSYYFSHHFGMWGWATWRRSWKTYDFHMQDWPALRGLRWPRDAFGGSGVWRQYARDFENVYRNNGKRGIVDTWDIQFAFAMLRERALCVKPSKNLVRNLGIGSRFATHTRLGSRLARVERQDLADTLSHPPGVVRTESLDASVIDTYYRRSEIAFEIKRQIKKFPAVAERLMHFQTYLHTHFFAQGSEE